VQPILIAGGVVALLGLSANVLLRVRHVRAIAPVAAAIIAVPLLASAGWSSVGGADDPAPTASCRGHSPPLGPADHPLPGMSRKNPPPFEISGLPWAPGPVVRASPHETVTSVAPATIGSILRDHDDLDYVTRTDSSRLYVHLEVGTPRPGGCPVELVYTVLRGQDGTRTQRITTLTPGPALARRHAVLACGRTSSGSGLNACAWASTTLFGAMEIFPVYRPDGFAEHELTEAEIIESADLFLTAVG
jgi:hypothetical protein